ncbi:MAG: peptidoglycan DD-metalloendopeptidase family protein [Candidatus Omnitrophica bacterium]|nr:peptidoglycan DD-metalloendopeptidase family protein [Candidatus Omnitrophota bacterium]
MSIFNKKILVIILVIKIGVLGFSGCATTPTVTLPRPSQYPGVGFYHRVEKGQTLWRISKLYNVDLEEIIKINRIADPRQIEIGQLIFIPQMPEKPRPQYFSKYEDFIWPIQGKVITNFGQTFDNMISKGINIQPYSSQNVLASRSGKVIFYAENFKGYGNTIIIDHDDGLFSIYARISHNLVKPGDIVYRGMPIAKIENVHNKSYLHFQIRKGHIPQDPYFYLPH